MLFDLTIFSVKQLHIADVTNLVNRVTRNDCLVHQDENHPNSRFAVQLGSLTILIHSEIPRSGKHRPEGYNYVIELTGSPRSRREFAFFFLLTFWIIRHEQDPVIHYSWENEEIYAFGVEEFVIERESLLVDGCSQFFHDDPSIHHKIQERKRLQSPPLSKHRIAFENFIAVLSENSNDRAVKKLSRKAEVKTTRIDQNLRREKGPGAELAD